MRGGRVGEGGEGRGGTSFQAEKEGGEEKRASRRGMEGELRIWRGRKRSCRVVEVEVRQASEDRERCHFACLTRSRASPASRTKDDRAPALPFT